MKQILMITLVVCFMASPVLAEDAPQLKLKSHSTAKVLSLIPINSPAIFYVKSLSGERNLKTQFPNWARF